MDTVKVEKCAACRYNRFIVEQGVENARSKFNRARYFKKLADAELDKIGMVNKVSILKPCSEMHKQQLIDLRKGLRKEIEYLKSRARKMLANAEHLFEQANLKYAEMLVQLGPNDARVVEAKWYVGHYKKLIGQRTRRLKELNR